MEEITNVDKRLSREELQLLIDTIVESESAKEKRRELSEKSFKEWIYDYLHNLFMKLGYTIASFEEFWKDISISAKTGWRDGIELAHKEAEHRRKMRERKQK